VTAGFNLEGVSANKISKNAVADPAMDFRERRGQSHERKSDGRIFSLYFKRMHVHDFYRFNNCRSNTKWWEGIL